MTPLLPLEDAQARLLALATPLPPEPVPLAQALGGWTGEPVVALRTQPAHDLSAMDGYAIRFADLPGPWRVIGESAAGRPFSGTVRCAEAVRIFTGAVLPEGSDSVLVQEEAARHGDLLALSGEGPRRQGGNVRTRGQDFAEGAVLLSAGERITAARLALAGAAGHATLPATRRVRVAIAATGDELVAPGAPVPPGHLPETNRLMLAAQLADLPVEVIDLGILPDDLAVLTEVFVGVEADLLVTSGGASVGDHDLVRPALEAAGAVVDFWRVALRPGKPVMAGQMRATIVLGLPGNPVSAFVTALLFVRPLVARLAGAADPLPATRTVPLGEALPANGPRTDYLRATLAEGRAVAWPVQDSGMLRALAGAHCLILRAPHAPPAPAGTPVEILPLA